MAHKKGFVNPFPKVGKLRPGVFEAKEGEGWPGVQHDRLCPQHLQLSFATPIFVVTATKIGVEVISNFINQELNLSFVASLTDASLHL